MFHIGAHQPSKAWLSKSSSRAALLFVAVFAIYVLLRRDPFISDESMYAYAGYAISKGSIPYLDIQLAHPPLIYLFLSPFADFLNPTLLGIVKALLTSSTSIAVFFVAEKSKLNTSQIGFPLIGVGVYVFMTLVYFYVTLLETLVAFLLFLCVALYVKHPLGEGGGRRKMACFLIGVLMGIAFMTKYLSLVFAASFLLFHLILLARKEPKKAIAEGGSMFLGFIIPVSIVLFLVAFGWKAYHQFYLQTVYWQMVRWPMPLNERIDKVLQYVLKFLPFLLLGFLGAFHAWKSSKKGNPTNLLIAIVFFVNFLCLILLFNTFFLHYLYYLSPFIALLSAHGLEVIWGFVAKKNHNRHNNLQKWGAVVLLVGCISFATVQLGAQLLFYQNFPWEDANREVSQSISEVTEVGDKIWTSEGAVALFAGRLVAAANSSDWPVQCAFSDVFSYDFDVYMGNLMRDYTKGVVSPQDFVESWEENKVKAIVIIKGTGWIPYPDSLLWSGFQAQKGVADYVLENYSLHINVISSDKAYVYEVWVRKIEN